MLYTRSIGGRWMKYTYRAWRYDANRQTEVPWEQLVPLPVCPPQTPHKLTSHRSRASKLTGRRLTASAMAQRPATLASQVLPRITMSSRAALLATAHWIYAQGRDFKCLHPAKTRHVFHFVHVLAAVNGRLQVAVSALADCTRLTNLWLKIRTWAVWMFLIRIGF